MMNSDCMTTDGFRPGTRWQLAVVLGVLAGLAKGAPDAAWHWEGGDARVLVRCAVSSDGGTACSRPLVCPVSLPLSGKQVRAWDTVRGLEVAAQASHDGTEVVLDPGRPLPAGTETRFWIYAGEGTETPAAITADGCSVETEAYIATIDPQHGGIIRSLKVKDGERIAEALGKGVRWWYGRNPQTDVESFGAVAVRLLESGPVFTRYGVSYPDTPAAGCTLNTTYTFFRDMIDVDYAFSIPKPIQIFHLKMPVDLSATGPFSGEYRASRTPVTDLVVSGKSNRWLPDPLWHDVVYHGTSGFGLGVIAREVKGSLYFMDSVQANEDEWIYAEPFGWQKPTEVSADFAVRFTLVPHGVNETAWETTPAKVSGRTAVTVSRVQRRGDPPIDSDSDGLPDLAELELTTNASAPDTDLDGIPDGLDPAPLRGPVTPRHLNLPDFTAAKTAAPQTVARVRPVKGVPTLVVDGQPVGPMLLTRCAASYEQLAEFADINYGVHFEMVGRVGWPGEQMTTFRRLDNQINRFLDEVPNARIILRLYLCSPANFARDYPDEVIRFNDGDTRHYTKWYAMTDRPVDERGYPSFASEIWRRRTAEALYAYVTHVRQSEYARNIIGYFICGGGTEEWYYWGDYDHSRYAVDFSAPMLREFRQYLRETYSGDVTALRRAWNDETVDFASALPPAPQERSETRWGVFWDPASQQRLRDYYYVHNKVMEDSVLIFARAVKQACDRQQLVGMFHGYLQNHWFLEGGQATLKEVLSSPDIDFWSGPPQYNRRGQGEHACNRFPGASLKAHGKLWISESDIRTNFSEVSGSNPALYGRSPDLAASLGCLTREFSHQLCDGDNGWWFPMGRNWYNHPPIMELFAQLQRVGLAAMAQDRRASTDVAAVIDLESLMTGPMWPISSAVLDAFKVQELCRLGTPVDFYELDDILARGAPRYRMIIMLNAFSLTDRERRQIDRRLRRRGTTLVWMFAPGLLNPDAAAEIAAGNCENLLGFSLAEERGTDLHFTMNLTEAGTAAFPDFSPDRVFGSFERPEWRADSNDPGKIVEVVPKPPTYRQRFIGVADDRAEVLARFQEGGEPAILRRISGGTTDIWIGSVMAPADLLRSIAREAGCHLFCDADEIVYADRSFLSLHAGRDGCRLFRLRRSADVIDVVTGETVARKCTEFEADIRAFETRTFFIGSEKKWRSSLADADTFHTRFQAGLRQGREERKNRQARTVVAPASPADPGTDYHPNADGMVTDFLFLGPFPSPGSGAAARGFETDFLGGEDACQPVAGAGVKTVFRAGPEDPEAAVWFGGKGGEKELDLSWKPIHVTEDMPILQEQIPNLFAGENVVYYVAAYVRLETPRILRVGIGSDDGFKLWVNGAYIGGENVSRGVGIDTNRYPVPMSAGANRILLKVVQGGGPSGWSLRLSETDGKNPVGCTIRLAP